MMETPDIITANLSSTTYSGDETGSSVGWETVAAVPFIGKIERRKQPIWESSTMSEGPIVMDSLKTEKGEQMKRRVVQVYVVDPNDNVPLDKAMLYKGDVKFTDLTDQELFFEINIKEVLDRHNEARKTFVDKEASKRSGRDVLLEPAKIRDLRMTVVEIAIFN